MRSTKHAREQQQRRGISDEQLALVMAYGEETKARGHASMLRITRKELEYVQGEWPDPLWRKYRDRINKIVPVVGADGRVITTMHRYRRLWQID
jgi:hypothetical protein